MAISYNRLASMTDEQLDDYIAEKTYDEQHMEGAARQQAALSLHRAKQERTYRR